MAIRLASCKELSEDKRSCSQIANHYYAIEKNGTPIKIPLPWFLSPVANLKKAKQKATKALYTMLSSTLGENL